MQGPESPAGHFYSHASCEARPYPPFFEIYFMPFLLTRLLRGATSIARSALGKIKFLLTRLLRGATSPLTQNYHPIIISTHTPLARRDKNDPETALSGGNFYSHASCEARPNSFKLHHGNEHFYSHASCEARRNQINRNRGKQ